MKPSYKIHVQCKRGWSETYSFHGQEAHCEAAEWLEKMKTDRHAKQIVMIRIDSDGKCVLVGKILVRNNGGEWTGLTGSANWTEMASISIGGCS